MQGARFLERMGGVDPGPRWEPGGPDIPCIETGRVEGFEEFVEVGTGDMSHEIVETIN
jgi:hypothetical protein